MSYPYPVHFIFNPALFAYSRFGKIYVSSGLRRKLSFDQFNAVIAHESGHLARDHFMEKLGTDILGIGLGALVLWSDVGIAVQLILLWAISIAWYFGRRQVNHWCEFDADQWAVRRGYGNHLASALCIVTTEHNLAAFEHPAVRDRVTRIYEKI